MRRLPFGSRWQVFVVVPVAKLGQQIGAAAVRHHLRDFRIRVAEIAEMAGANRADHHASRQPVLFREGFVVDPVDAQRAFLHYAGVFVKFARTIGASPRAQLAADADLFIDQNDPVLGALIGGTGRAHGHAGRLLAMQAGFREINGARALPVTLLERMDAVVPDAPGTGTVGVEIRQRPRVTAGIPLLAGGSTSMAADTDIEVDDEPEFLLARSRLRQRGHRDPSFCAKGSAEFPDPRENSRKNSNLAAIIADKIFLINGLRNSSGAANRELSRPKSGKLRP